MAHDIYGNRITPRTFDSVSYTDEQKDHDARIREEFQALEDSIKVLCKDGRLKAMALSYLEIAGMLAIKAIAR